MPNYVCGRCKTRYPNQASKPTCDVQVSCQGGKFVNEERVTVPVVQLTPPASYTLDGQRAVARGLNMASPTTRNHQPQGAVYIHNGGRFAISPDGSTHDGGRGAWKGFQLTGQGWTYLGSYDAQLNHAGRGATNVPTLPQ